MSRVSINDKRDTAIDSNNRFPVESKLVDENGNVINESNRLPVDAQLEVGDIQIGAVEIKDATTDTRQNVASDGVHNAAFIQRSKLKIIIDDTTTTDITYIGKAVFGTATSASSWQIMRIDDSSGTETVIEMADGDDSFDNVFDDRASLTYS